MDSVNPKLSSYHFKSQLKDKSVVIEFGKRFTKCGFAGEPSPRAIIKTDENLHNTNNVENLAAFIEKIYFSYLAVSPKEKRVVIVESIFTKSTFRNSLVKLFLEVFEVPSILFVPDHLMALSTLGISTALIVDLGSSEAISFAVSEGVTLLDCTQFANLGSKALDDLIKRELVKSNPSLKQHIDEECVEDVRVKSCFVAPFQRGRVIASKKFPKSKNMQLEALQSEKISSLEDKNCYFIDDGDEESPKSLQYLLENQYYIRIPGNIRESACEMFFEIYGYEHSLTTMIIETIMSAPIDCRKSLSENIFIIGGLANLPGLEHRLSQELININEYQRYTRKIISDFKFHKPICPRNYISWLGASIFCSSSSTDNRSINREQWFKDGKPYPKDWCDLISSE